ncbi:MAG TPA: type II secretion system minor pseudopilin GspK [Noviherbaspirillum sp.]|nr:type II secretion system minor pseudopilin GspK [Noviherbaspirillum sp.]
MKAHCMARQRGVAVVTALLLTTLAITIVASLFWQQQVQVRSIENQRLQLQKQWILRGALDWTRLILREDKRITPNVDHLGEPWAVPLAETRLDEYVEKGGANTDVPDAALSGGITDAQARFNLTNLLQNGAVNPVEVAVLGRLLRNAGQSPALAQAVADLMVSAQRKSLQEGSNPGSSAAQPLNILYVDDLLAVTGFTPEILTSIRDFIVVLPRMTQINVNTAPAEVLAARIDTLSLSDAAALVASRKNTWFRNEAEFGQRLQAQGKQLGTGTGQIAVSTNYFLVNGNVRLNRAGMQMQALIDRSAANPKVLWIRED